MLTVSSVLPFSEQSACAVSAVVRGIEMGFVPAPLHHIHVQSPLVTGFFDVGVRSSFPIDGVDFIMGNDIAGGKVYPVPEVVNVPIADSEHDSLVQNHPNIFTVSVLTRAQTSKQAQDIDLADTLFASVLTDNSPSTGTPVECTLEAEKVAESVTAPVPLPLTREALISAQQNDPSLAKCLSTASQSSSECRKGLCFFFDKDVLMRRWVSQSVSAEDNSGDDWSTVYQIVVPVGCRQHVLALAHEHLWSGYLGITKTYNRVLKHFFWPGMKRDVVHFCKTCGVCQIVGKPNQVVQPVPAIGESFEHVIVDCVGLLPRTNSGNQFLLTVMCVATHFPEAIPLLKITAPAVSKALLKFFTTFGLPKVVQTDQGTNFLSRTFKDTLQSLGISHSVSSAYHPQSQGALERWHQTLKSMLSKFCQETGKYWDDGVPFVLFAIRDAKQESLGFSPAELVFGHNVCGPLKVLKEKFVNNVSPRLNVSEFVSQCRERSQHAALLAKEALSSFQASMMKRFDRKAVKRQFGPGDKVLVLLPTPGSALTARFSGPYVVESRVSDTDYVIHTPERRTKTRLRHINMVKPFHSRAGGQEEPKAVPVIVTPSLICVTTESDGLVGLSDGNRGGRLSNSEWLSCIEDHLSYLPEVQRRDVMDLIYSYPNLFGAVPSCTTVLEHDIDVGNAKPIKQHAYRCSMEKRESMKKEVSYLVENGLAKPSSSPWSSLCLLAPKSDGTPRFCTDFRKVNAVTVPDSFPLPRIEDCIDSIGPSTFITKLDLLKGYWQVPLTIRASDISTFVTP
uniref:Gypsy retrotransposon integrase-like protein 1 n=1 Tax=Acanthochromis polyacanthus TaxID=80966 RepID=A0A3Q1F7N1_9TELE